MRHERNAVVLQSGGCTAVMNRSLYGIVDEALSSGAFASVHGARRGVEGLASGDLVDLGGRSERAWTRIARSPGAALGSTRRRVTDDDLPPILRTLARRGIGHLFLIGGNDSAENAMLLADHSSRDIDLTVMSVPKTIDNDLAGTDHSPGYGSAARFVALATMGAGRDAEAMGAASPMTVMEVMGRDTGWLAASAALAKREERDAPHLICVPETPVCEETFLERMEDTLRRFGFAVAVVAENARGPDGVLGRQDEPRFVDDFGHPYHAGAGRYLAELAESRLGARVRYEKPGTIQRSMAALVSPTDAAEAERAGREAVRSALEGRSGEMVSLVREPGAAYGCGFTTVPLSGVAGRVRAMPARYLDVSLGMATPDFIEYAGPLAGRLPTFGRL